MTAGSEMLLERVRSATADEYTIEGELGRGGMAAVYLARDIALQRRVAIKVMLPDLVDVEGIADRFVIEARTAAHLDHPNIVTVYSVKQRAGLLFIVMKYIEGRTLDDVLKGDHALDVGVVTSIVSQVAEALHFAHGEGVVHRDVKPSNILIDTRGRPVVTDFGIAKITSGKSITMTGAMIGTPAYMSPEQCRGLPATTASDQYSLGVMTYEMLARRLPFEGTLFELIHAHSDMAPPPLKEAAPGLDVGVEETVLRMLAKNPRERWPSMAEVSKRFTQTAAHHRRTSDVRETIAALARAPGAERPARRGAMAIDLSGAATEVATTPAPALVITPSDPSIEVGETVQMKVSESSGASLGGIRVVWKSEDPSIAVVDVDGMVSGRSVGFAKITATGGAAFGRVAVTVKPPRVDTLVVTPQNPELETDNELQLKATAIDARGNIVPDQQILWTSSNVSVCAVSQQGRAIGTAPGRAEIIANCGDVRGVAQVKVRAPAVERVVVQPGDPSIEVEQTLRLSAAMFGSLNRTLIGRPIAWRSSAPSIVSVASDGTIQGVAPGSAAIIATCEGKDGMASVNVRSQPVIAVRILPASLQIEAGRSLQLQGIAEDRRSRPVSGRGLEWSSDDDQIALVDASGKVHAVREGKTTVRATADDVTSAIDVTVIPRPAAQIRIEAHVPSLTVGEFLTLDAAVLDAEGATLHGRTVTWTSSDPETITVSGNGACAAKRPGTVRITAACEKARATTKLNASALPVIATEAVTAKMRAPVPKSAAASTAPPASAPPASAPPAVAPSSRPAAPVGAAVGAAAGASAHVATDEPEAAAPVRAKRANRVPLLVGAVLVITAVGVWFGTRDRDSGTAVATTTPTSTTGDSVPVAAPPPAPPNTPAVNAPLDTKAASGSPQRPADRPSTPSPTTTKQLPQSGTTSVGAPGGVQRTVAAPPETTRVVSGGPPANRDTATRTPPVTAAAQDTTTRPPPVTIPTPPPNNPAAAAPPPSNRVADSVAAIRALLCGSSSTAVDALTSAISSDPAARLNTLYVPRDAGDTRAKTALASALRGLQRLRMGTVRALRAETAGDGCDWVMSIEFSGTNSFGQPRQRTVEIRAVLEAAAGVARVKHLFGATGQ